MEEAGMTNALVVSSSDFRNYAVLKLIGAWENIMKWSTTS